MDESTPLKTVTSVFWKEKMQFHATFRMPLGNGIKNHKNLHICPNAILVPCSPCKVPCEAFKLPLPQSRSCPVPAKAG